MESKSVTFNNMRAFMGAVLSVLPTASFDTDNMGQIVIYTNLQEDDDETIVQLDGKLT